MGRHSLIAFCFILCAVSSLHGQSSTTVDYGNNAAAGHYKMVNGISMYYEVYGGGKPLVLLHGNGGAIKGQAKRIEYFQKYFQVIAIDSRAHGKSIDTTTKTLSYDQMASDIKVLLDSLNIDSAYVWGQSDGGILGLLLASKYPNKVSKLATFGGNIYPGDKAVFKEIDDLVRDTLKTTKDFQTRRLFSLLANQPHITHKGLQKISADVLIMSGDRDVIRLEHSKEIFDNIPNANLFVMPGATHFGAYEKPELFNMVLLDFLTKPFSKVSTVELFTGKPEKVSVSGVSAPAPNRSGNKK
jgi:pimeloyl-ACP methyl ester carboxylesterase